MLKVSSPREMLVLSKRKDTQQTDFIIKNMKYIANQSKANVYNARYSRQNDRSSSEERRSSSPPLVKNNAKDIPAVPHFFPVQKIVAQSNKSSRTRQN